MMENVRHWTRVQSGEFSTSNPDWRVGEEEEDEIGFTFIVNAP
jgi:hypothetical protein